MSSLLGLEDFQQLGKELSFQKVGRKEMPLKNCTKS